MTQLNSQPSKEQVRQWLMQRMANCEPLPDIEQIQRSLGWKQTKTRPVPESNKAPAPI